MSEPAPPPRPWGQNSPPADGLAPAGAQAPRLRRTLYVIAAGVAVFLVLTLWLLFPYLKAFGDVGAGPENSPSRLYALPEEIRTGEEMSPEESRHELETQGYRAWMRTSCPPAATTSATTSWW